MKTFFLQCIQTWKPREISPFRKLLSKPVSNKKIKELVAAGLPERERNGSVWKFPSGIELQQCKALLVVPVVLSNSF